MKGLVIPYVVGLETMSSGEKPNEDNASRNDLDEGAFNFASFIAEQEKRLFASHSQSQGSASTSSGCYKSPVSTKRKRKRNVTETCQACRFSRVRCDNIGQFTKCKRCTRLGLQCRYMLSINDNTQQNFIALEPAVQETVKLGACNWCKIKKTKCEDSEEGGSTCKLCLKHNRTCVRNKATRGRPLSGFTRRLLATPSVNTPFDPSNLPSLLICSKHSEKDKDSYVLDLVQFCADHKDKIADSFIAFAPLVNTMMYSMKSAEDYDYIKDFANYHGITTSISPRSSGHSVGIQAQLNLNQSAFKYFLDSISSPDEKNVAWIAMSFGEQWTRYQTNEKFLELFCTTKHVDGKPVNSLALPWSSIISPSSFRNIVENVLLQFLQESREHDIISTIIEENLKLISGEYSELGEVYLNDKNNDVITCKVHVKYEIQRDGRISNVALIMKNIFQGDKNEKVQQQMSRSHPQSGQKRPRKRNKKASQ